MAHRVVVPGEPVAAGADGDRHELVIRCAALTPVLARRRPRPRWKTYLVSHQNLRWVRTSLLGRQAGRATSPPPVGPWRPVRLVPLAGPALVDRHVVATCVGAGGQVRVRVRLRRAATTTEARLHVGDVSGTLSLTDEGDVQVAHGVLRLPTVERWWPHTHGDQRLYPVALVVDGSKVDLGKVGFRTVDADRADDGFSLRVNGEPVFCRGACWTPIDPVSLVAPPGEPRATLEAARRAGMNMVRIPGTTAYEDDDFWDLCDELGILVWQDCMLAYYDPPQDAGFEAAVEAELEGVFSHLSGRPSLTVVCGGQETEAQPAMLGLARHTWECPLQLKLIPALVERILPGTPYVSSNPSGGALPFQMNAGVAHYFGVGAYLRPVADARRAGVRFATECLAYAAPPPRRTVDEVFGGPVAAAWDPAWKLAVHYDAGRSWDSEDMQGYYVRVLFGVDAFESRYRDPDRAMDLNRATVATVMERVLTEWRRPGSTCSGALVLALRDHHPGAGWGVIDSLGRPKAPWFALGAGGALAPGPPPPPTRELNGLQAQRRERRGPAPFRGSLAVRAFSRGELAGGGRTPWRWRVASERRHHDRGGGPLRRVPRRHRRVRVRSPRLRRRRPGAARRRRWTCG